MDEVMRGADRLVLTCGDVEPGETVLIISDPGTSHVGDAIKAAALKVTNLVSHRIIEPLTMHGQEPPKDISDEMLQSAVVFGVTEMSLAHSQARFLANQAGARYLSLPGYSVEVLTSPALLADFRALTPVANRLAELLTAGSQVTLRTPLGSDLTCNVATRQANAAPGWCWAPGTLASPPDAEVNVPPLEDGSDGVIVVDGSIPCAELGLLHTPLRLTVEKGRVVHVEGECAETLNTVFDRLGDPATRVIAEFGIGLNPLAELRGFMLEDEGCLGTVHLGIGSNATMGGQNRVPFHLDHMVRHATVTVDGRPVIENGQIVEAIWE